MKLIAGWRTLTRIQDQIVEIPTLMLFQTRATRSFSQFHAFVSGPLTKLIRAANTTSRIQFHAELIAFFTAFHTGITTLSRRNRKDLPMVLSTAQAMPSKMVMMTAAMTAIVVLIPVHTGCTTLVYSQDMASPTLDRAPWIQGTSVPVNQVATAAAASLTPPHTPVAVSPTPRKKSPTLDRAPWIQGTRTVVNQVATFDTAPRIQFHALVATSATVRKKSPMFDRAPWIQGTAVPTIQSTVAEISNLIEAQAQSTKSRNQPIRL